MIDGAQHRDAIVPIVEALCRVHRPASILTWKRSLRVQQLLTGLASGKIPLTHDGFDEAGPDKAVNHLRSMLEHAGVLAARDEPLARFERWLSVKLAVVTEPTVRGPVEQFATWHHLRRLRKASVPGQDSARLLSLVVAPHFTASQCDGSVELGHLGSSCSRGLDRRTKSRGITFTKC